MKRSEGHIFTSHVGSLPRPSELLELYREGAGADELEPGMRAAVADVVHKQAEAGIDVVNDGEFGKPMSEEVDYGAWGRYLYQRLSGFELREFPDIGIRGKDRNDFEEFYASGEADTSARGVAPKRAVCVGPISYIGQALVQRDIDNLKAGLDGSKFEEAFISAVAPDTASSNPGEHYASAEEQAAATAEAMREEYRAITDAGLNVQLDDPFMVSVFERLYSIDGDMKGFRKWAEHHVELVNHALEGVPEDQVRYHVCWGSWKGPHSSDLPLKDAIDLVLKINASQYSVEAGNVQHEHEWKVWRDAKLPDGRTVMPGVVTHKTNVIEHPELVADRIGRYAEAVGRENVIAGTDCGMGGRIHPQVAWAKLKALSDGAALASARLWS